MPRTGCGGPKRSKCKKRYLFSNKALAKVFRAKVRAAIAGEGRPLPARHAETWVVDCKYVGAGEKTLVYLGRDLYRGVIRERHILACEDGQLTFRYQDTKTQRTETRTVSGPNFLWLILQHVSPRGFRRARHFGFLHPSSKGLLTLAQYLLGFDPKPAPAWIKPRPKLACPCCGAAMTILATRLLPSSAVPPPAPIGDGAGAAMM